MRSLTLALLLVLPGAVAPVAAETRQHGNVLFDIPQGWGYGVIGPTGTLRVWAGHASPDCPNCEILIGAGAVDAGPVDAFLAANSRRLIDPEALPPPPVEPIAAPGTYLLQGRYPAAYQQQWVDTRYQALFAVQVGDRIELIAFQAPYVDDATMDRVIASYDATFTPFMEKLRFVSDGAPPLLPAAQPGGLSGVWWRAQYWTTTTMNYYTGIPRVNAHSHHEWLTFWPDGRFYHGTPPQGIAPLDTAALLARADMNWGIYRQQGLQVTLHHAHGEVRTFRIDGTRLVDSNDISYEPVQLYADGTSVEGRVDRFGYVDFDALSGLAGGSTSASEITFYPDGTWSGTSASATGGNFAAGGGFAADASAQVDGRYQVKDGLLLTYDRTGQLYGSHYLFHTESGTIWVGKAALD